jgi:hypothetical protein
VVARGQLTNPINIMRLIVAVASFAIGQMVSLAGGHRLTVIARSLISPAIVAADKVIQLTRQRRTHPAVPGILTTRPAASRA